MNKITNEEFVKSYYISARSEKIKSSDTENSYWFIRIDSGLFLSCGPTKHKAWQSAKKTIINLKIKKIKKIIIDEGGTFEGTVEQFANCFFYNVYEEEIIKWCKKNGSTYKFEYEE